MLLAYHFLPNIAGEKRKCVGQDTLNLYVSAVFHFIRNSFIYLGKKGIIAFLRHAT